MTEVTTALKALSEEIRIRLLLVLMEKEACVCELMATFDMAQSKLSHHLIALRDAGFIKDDKRGKWNYYRIDLHSLDPMRRKLLSSLSEWVRDETTVSKDRQALSRVKDKMQICC
ncbi:MAG TPA: metalloregulator ArsR/SmtB family transcription factor [Bacteroidota bacterium]|nr:metalloregulator ArsR/SmtB family transcription factor [Bacteroidota bacterium]